MWKERFRGRKITSRRFSPAKIAKIIFACIVAGTVLFFVALPILALTLPSADKIVRRDGFSTKILDRKGKLLYDIYEDKKRNPVSLEEVPKQLRQATVAIEDKDFYKHAWFDPLTPLRIAKNIITKRRIIGGSTLTQQLVKNVLLSPDRTVIRKVKEFVLSAEIEQKFTKDEILLMYLNEAPYGGTSWGVGSAAETYFGKKVSELTLAECAILAGLPQRPSTFSPYSSTPKAYVTRTKDVLRRMREDGYISKDEEAKALEEMQNIAFKPKGSDFKAPHFVFYVQKLLEDKYGENALTGGGLKITTTLDLDLQEKAQTIVAEEIAKSEKFNITNGSAMVIDPQTGEILSMVGSKDFNDPNYDGQFNVATASRQPGSSIKPFTYATAFKKGYTPATLLMDSPTTFPGGVGQPDYSPVNYDGKFRGPVQLRYALGNSFNIPAVKLLALVGIKDMLTTAYDMGITTLPPTDETLKRVGLSVTLGGGEVKLIDLTSAYSGFVNGGYRVEPVAILKVETKDGKVLEENTPKKGKQVITSEQAYLIASILSDNKAREIVFGPNSSLNISGRSIAVKTGTTNERKDNWTIGGSPQMMIGVWVGNNNNSSMKQLASGVTGAAPIWRRIILEGLKGKPNVAFVAPEKIVNATVDTVSGYKAHDGFPERTEYFIKGTEPGEDTVHVKLKVCKNDGKLATPTDIASGNYDDKEFFVFKEEDPTAPAGGENRWQKGILDWLSTQTDGKYHPPSDYCGASNPVNVDFVTPGDRTSNLSNDFQVKIRAESTVAISEVWLEVDGLRIRTFTGPPYEHQLTLGNGIHKLKVHAKDVNGRESEREITIGVNTSWEATPAPTPVDTPNPTAAPSSSPT